MAEYDENFMRAISNAADAAARTEEIVEVYAFITQVADAIDRMQVPSQEKQRAKGLISGRLNGLKQKQIPFDKLQDALQSLVTQSQLLENKKRSLGEEQDFKTLTVVIEGWEKVVATGIQNETVRSIPPKRIVPTQTPKSAVTSNQPLANGKLRSMSFSVAIQQLAAKAGLDTTKIQAFNNTYLEQLRSNEIIHIERYRINGFLEKFDRFAKHGDDNQRPYYTALHALMLQAAFDLQKTENMGHLADGVVDGAYLKTVQDFGASAPVPKAPPTPPAPVRDPAMITPAMIRAAAADLTDRNGNGPDAPAAKPHHSGSIKVTLLPVEPTPKPQPLPKAELVIVAAAKAPVTVAAQPAATIPAPIIVAAQTPPAEPLPDIIREPTPNNDQPPRKDNSYLFYPSAIQSMKGHPYSPPYLAVWKEVKELAEAQPKDENFNVTVQLQGRDINLGWRRLGQRTEWAIAVGDIPKLKEIVIERKAALNVAKQAGKARVAAVAETPAAEPVAAAAAAPRVLHGMRQPQTAFNHDEIPTAYESGGRRGWVQRTAPNSIAVERPPSEPAIASSNGTKPPPHPAVKGYGSNGRDNAVTAKPVTFNSACKKMHQWLSQHGYDVQCLRNPNDLIKKTPEELLNVLIPARNAIKDSHAIRTGNQLLQDLIDLHTRFSQPLQRGDVWGNGGVIR